MAKLTIRLITGIAEVVNTDATINGGMKVVFYPDFNVKNGHWIYPAADLSEQISTLARRSSACARFGTAALQCASAERVVSGGRHVHSH